MRVAIAGFGDLGQRLAQRLSARGHAVLGLRRRPPPASGGIETRACDVGRLRPGALADWGAEALVVALSPDQRSPEGYRHTYLQPLPVLNAALGATLQRSLLVSSTAVYADADGGWVDERTAPAPERWNGALLWEAERCAAGVLPGLVIARPSGLYGPDRSWLWRRALSGEPGDARWTNRIHVDDAASALAHLLDVATPLACYCLNDDAPSPEHVVLNGLRALRGLPAIAPASMRPHGRRVSNALLRSSGWVPRYPSWREGYAGQVELEH